MIIKPHAPRAAHYAALGMLACSLLFFLYTQIGFAEPALGCSADYYVAQPMPNGSLWELCWERRAREGIVFHDLTFTTPTGERRLVLSEAALAQLHVPYDDDGARYHDVTDFGLGGNALQTLISAECPNGTLLDDKGVNILCQQLLPRGYAYKDVEEQKQGHLLSLYSTSLVGAYNYIFAWRLHDDGTIEPMAGATGRLQRLGSDSRYGWPVRNDATVGIAHLHNYYWRLDFDLNGTSGDDIVEEINLTQIDSRLELSATPLLTETARTVNPTTLRRWRIKDGVSNSEGHALSYQIELLNLGHRDEGPATEPWTFHDVYVTNNAACEQFASHNPTTGGCPPDVSGFVNGEAIDDAVVWVGLTFHHIPRDEDEPNMHAHWNSFRITPRDWTVDNPLAPPASQPTQIDLLEVRTQSTPNTVAVGAAILLMVAGLTIFGVEARSQNGQGQRLGDGD